MHRKKGKVRANARQCARGAGVADLPAFKDYKRTYREQQTAGIVVQDVNDLKNWAALHQVPATFNEMDATGKTLYAIPHDWGDYPATIGVVLTGYKGMNWLRQVLAQELNYGLHIDGKHKLHFGKWIVVTVGTHYLRWDQHNKVRCNAHEPAHTH